MSRPMRVAIVGATGFVGYALSESLGRIGHTEIFRLQRPDFELTDMGGWNLPDGLDAVVIAAGATTGDSGMLHAVNVAGPARLAGHCRKRGVRRLVLLSSGAVYGDTSEATHPGLEAKPSSAYGRSKLEGECAVREAWGGEGLAVLRLYFPYGPGQRSPRLMPRLVQRVADGQPIVCRPDGGPVLSLTHISDLQDIVIRDFVAGARDGVFNIASDVRASIEQIAWGIGTHLGRAPNLDRSGAAMDCISVPYEGQRTWCGLDLCPEQYIQRAPAMGNGRAA